MSQKSTVSPQRRRQEGLGASCVRKDHVDQCSCLKWLRSPSPGVNEMAELSILSHKYVKVQMAGTGTSIQRFLPKTHWRRKWPPIPTGSKLDLLMSLGPSLEVAGGCS